MSRITKVVSIKSDPKSVLEYIADIENHPAFISALKSVDNLSGNARNVGETWDFTFTMGGVDIIGKAETSDYVEGKVYAFKTTNGITSTFRYTVEPESDGTRLTMDVEYEIPENVLAKILDKSVIEGLNDQEGDRAVGNLKAILSS